MKDTDWWIYMIRTQDNQLYTGITTNVQKRWLAHIKGAGAKYFRAHPPKNIDYLEPSTSRGIATQREYALKQLKKRDKEQLIVSHSKDTAHWLKSLGFTSMAILDNDVRGENAA